MIDAETGHGAAPEPARTAWLFRGPSGYQSHSPWGPLNGFLAAFGVLLVSFIGAAVVIVAGQIVGIPISEPLIVIGATLVQQALMIALSWLAAGGRGVSRTAALGLGRPRQSWWIYPLILVLLVGGAIVMSNIARMIDPTSGRDDLKMFQDLLKTQWWWLVLVMVGIGAPLSEEFLFRGLLFPALAKSRLGVWGAAILTSAPWAMIHMTYAPVTMVQVFVIGLFFCWVVVRTGSLWVPVVCHGVYNFIMASLLIAGFAP